MEPAVLLIDDEPSILHGLARALRNQPYRLHTATSAEEAMRVLKSRRVGVIVVDEHMPGMRGSELLAWVAQHCPEVMRIVLTGQPTVDTAIRAINEGRVYQFFTKPCNAAHLAVAIRKALEHTSLLEENRRLREDNGRQLEELERLRNSLEILNVNGPRYEVSPSSHADSFWPS